MNENNTEGLVIFHYLQEAQENKSKDSISKCINITKLLYNGNHEIDNEVLRTLYNKGVTLTKRTIDTGNMSVTEYGLKYKDLIISI